MLIPKPLHGSETKTCVTAPTSLPSCITGLPLMPCTMPPVFASSAGDRAQLRIGHGQHHALAACLVVDAVYLRVILLRLAAVHGADYRRGACVHIAGFNYDAARPRENVAVNAKLGVLFNVAQCLGRVGAAVQFAGRTAAAGHDADYLRVHYAALAQRHKKLGSAVAYAVPQRAVHAAFGVDKGQRADA